MSKMLPTEDEVDDFFDGTSLLDLVENRFSKPTAKTLFNTEEKLKKAKKKFSKLLYSYMITRYRYHDRKLKKFRELKKRAREDLEILKWD